eukprot:TRINITY_DN3486_c0_g1_i2.p1 TRINITY_DN3486_c0_g1~~TRINITY_DN3486_c0_g1_i2.p1  ORF type:complete len:328 (+),score=20.15 TRINITY_DN3486_c0_g1_i2:273-1256(+)
MPARRRSKNTLSVVANRYIPLQGFVETSVADQKRSSAAIAAFGQWLARELPFMSIDVLLEHPNILSALIRSYANSLYLSGGSLYQLIGLITGLQKRSPSIRGHLASAWAVVTEWQVRHPTKHRSPLPEPVVLAMCMVAISLGWFRWAGVTLAAFYGIARTGEMLAALRSHLVLPSDLLLANLGRAYIHVSAPKTGRGRGPAQQHVTIRLSWLVSLLSEIFEHLPASEPLYPLSTYAYRKRWDTLLSLLHVAPSVFTPGGLRGGGAVYWYMNDAPVATIQWQMRIADQKTLSFYLQEVSALNSLSQLSVQARAAVRTAAQMFHSKFVH